MQDRFKFRVFDKEENKIIDFNDFRKGDMMNEVEKMYENANIEPDCTYLFLVDGNGENEAARAISIGSKADLKRLIVDCGVKGKVIKSTNTLKPFYPPFTAEKQIQLENFLLEDLENKTFKQFEMLKTIENKFLYVYRFSKNNLSLKRFDTTGETRQECIAKLINNLWQDLTEEERKQIKNILE